MGLSDGSEAITDGLAFNGLITLLEEHCEEEVKAGRMVLVRDGPPGDKVYGPAPAATSPSS